MAPYNEVMGKFKAGNLHSGSKTGKKVTSQKQAVAIMLSEKREAAKGKSEYKESDESKRKKKAEAMMGKGAHAAPKR